jgi:hypothetical protein
MNSKQNTIDFRMNGFYCLNLSVVCDGQCLALTERSFGITRSNGEDSGLQRKITNAV